MTKKSVTVHGLEKGLVDFVIFLNRRKLRKGKHRGTEFTEETKEHQLRVLCVSVFISSFLNT